MTNFLSVVTKSGQATVSNAELHSSEKKMFGLDYKDIEKIVNRIKKYPVE